MSFAYIRRTYGVPAKRGARVRYNGGYAGRVTSARHGYIRIWFDGFSKVWPAPFHPTWNMEWLDAKPKESPR